MKKLLFSSLIAMLMLASCQNEAKKDGADSTGIDSNATPPPVPPPAPVSDSTAIDSNSTAQETGDTEVFNFQSMTNPPKYPGGMESFYKQIASNLSYPKEAAEKKVEGSVFISFIVEKDGTLSDVKVTRKLGYGLDEEAIKAVKTSKKWNPGTNDGKPVRVKFDIPVKFSLT